MSVQETTTLKSAYAGKVAADLAENAAEQERIRAELEALQAQLASLEADHALLEGVSAALGGISAPVPAPRRGAKKAAGAAGSRAAAPAKKRAVKKAPSTDVTVAKKPAARGGGAKAAKSKADKGVPLTELIHAHLSAQNEPRTAREISKVLAEANPGRTINDNLVRTTTERLVGRSRAHRVKQGSTVYYTAVTTEAAGADSEPAEPTTAAAS
ncbi:hypothetical protein [Streptomyces sp. NBC_00467]|uniref:hypothetical protein n=1 Tax=Streptomyces sp. NBC_00467 TaxID=2975752 RepID=UPI002E18E211